MASDPVTPKEPAKPKPDKPTRAFRVRHPSFTLLLIWVVGTGVIAFILPYWWMQVPFISLAGLISWKRTYFLGVAVGAIYGGLLWTGQLLLLPSAPLGRIASAVAGVEGLSPIVLYAIGPILFALVCGIGAGLVAGVPRFLSAFRRSGRTAALP